MTPRRLIEPARLAGTSMLCTQSDARLVDLVRAGHASAFEAIVQRYRKQLLAYCSRLLPASRAEDAVQQTLLKAYQAMVSGDAELNLRPWLYRIAHNSSLNLLRQNGWSHEQLDENMDGVQRPDQALELRERLRATVSAVKALPERQRNAVLLREVDGLSYEEIALALGVGDGAVRQLLHRARATLRAGLTAATPAGLVERVAAALASGADPSSRATEVAAGLGLGAGAAKVGAAMLATGVIATGAVSVPLSHHSSHHRTHGATASEASLSPSSSGDSSSRPGAPVTEVDHRIGRGQGSHHRGESHSGGHHGSHRSSFGERSEDRHRSSGRSGSGDAVERHSGSGRSGGSDDRVEHSGSGGSGDSGASGEDRGTDDGSTPLQSEDADHSGHGGGGDTLTPTATSGTTLNGSSSDGSSSGSGGGD